MYALCFNITREGYNMVLGSDNNKHNEFLSCRPWYDKSQLESHFMHEKFGIRTYYIGEDVLHMFDPNVEILDVLKQLHDYIEDNVNEAHATKVCQRLIGRNNGTVVFIENPN